jgi:hypothetical protein
MNSIVFLATVGSGVNLLPVILTLLLVGVVMWLINSYAPISAGWKKLINIVAAIIVVIWLLQVFGVWGYIGSVHT